MYALKIGRISLLAECLAMEASYMLAVCLLWHFNSVATLWVFVVPYLLSSLALMFGNWYVPLAHVYAVQRSANVLMLTADTSGVTCRSYMTSAWLLIC